MSEIGAGPLTCESAGRGNRQSTTKDALPQATSYDSKMRQKADFARQVQIVRLLLYIITIFIIISIIIIIIIAVSSTLSDRVVRAMKCPRHAEGVAALNCHPKTLT